MSLEIISPAGEFIYRQRPGDPCVIESRRNKANARWLRVEGYATAEEARAALLQIEAGWRRKAAEQEGDA